jgi:peptide/nickel transport system permease protein
VDGLVVGGTTFFAAVPAFIASVVLLSVFAVDLGWFPALGGGHGLFDQIKHLTLPAVALALAALATVARVTRVSVRAEASREHVQTAVSLGLPRRTILRRHVLRNAAIPITTVVGLAVIAQIALAAVVEQAFGLNGLGAGLVQAAASKDIPTVQGIALVLVTAFVLCNAAIDVLYAWLDPRVTLGAQHA